MFENKFKLQIGHPKQGQIILSSTFTLLQFLSIVSICYLLPDLFASELQYKLVVGIMILWEVRNDRDACSRDGDFCWCTVAGE